MAEKPEQVTAQVIKILYEADATNWTIQDKGQLMAAVKLQLSESARRGEKAKED